ncbi:MAG: dihydrolipoamide acetyltransferase family protein [Bryobacteraceae bacterium]
MSYEIVMPQLGLTMTEGSVTQWLKNIGDRVEKGDLLFLVQTDKVEMEVESLGSGFLARILVPPGEVVPVGTPIALLTKSMEEAVATAEPIAAVTPGLKAAPANRTAAASPRARKVAAELGIDLAAVTPGTGGRITEEDVRRAAAAAPKSDGDKRTLAARKAVAARMELSFRSAPHFYVSVDADAGELVRLRDGIVGTGKRVSYTDLFLKAMAIAIVEQPEVNAWWNQGEVVPHTSVDLAFAAQTDHGLVAPVLRQCDSLTLFDLAARREVLTERARSGKLTLEDIEGGSATLSNLGAFGIDSFNAILNPPQSVILATGRIADRPRAVGKLVEVRPSVQLTLSADHRVLDGAAAARFLVRIRELIEQPGLLVR